ncbi:hypothetical protein [Achromobacter aloeverae]|uniref:hypothetical protein n=1 Tax=Achromobacter aloeverae TaxID=1750518 RepID=UPI00100EB77B|nr:hypothetical protein [Achromobacter aloeverae]
MAVGLDGLQFSRMPVFGMHAPTTGKTGQGDEAPLRRASSAMDAVKNKAKARMRCVVDPDAGHRKNESGYRRRHRALDTAPSWHSARLTRRLHRPGAGLQAIYFFLSQPSEKRSYQIA